MKRIISLCAAAVLIAACCIISAGAMPYTHTYYYGDIDKDTYVTAVDSVLIQRYNTKVCDFDLVQSIAADYDHDDDITVVDATFVQRKATRVSVPDFCGGMFSDYTRVKNFYADYDSGMAMVGVPVTFTAVPQTGNKVTSYTFSIEKHASGYPAEKIYELTTAEDHFTYTFDESVSWDDNSYYEIFVVCDDLFGNIYNANARMYYSVAEPYSTEKPVVVSSHYEDIYNTSNLLTVGAVGGTAPYNYIFRIDLPNYEKKVESYDGELYDYRIETDPESGTQYIIQDEPGTDKSLIPFSFLQYYDSYNDMGFFRGCYVTVTAADADGVLSEPYKVSYSTVAEIG